MPILIAGSGDRVLTIAARRAQIIGIAGGSPDGTAPAPRRARGIRAPRAAGERFDDLELNLAIIGSSA